MEPFRPTFSFEEPDYDMTVIPNLSGVSTAKVLQKR
jgi:hypothetical protein